MRAKVDNVFLIERIPRSWAHFKFSLLKSAIWFKFKKQTPQL